MSDFDLITFDVPGPPVPKKRPRTAQRPDGKCITITPKETVAYEKHIKLCAMSAKSKWERNRGNWPLEHAHGYNLFVQIYTSSKSIDGDNVIKSAMDGLQGVLFKNDKSVVKGGWEFMSRTEEDKPRLTITVVLRQS